MAKGVCARGCILHSVQEVGEGAWEGKGPLTSFQTRVPISSNNTTSNPYHFAIMASYCQPNEE